MSSKLYGEANRYQIDSLCELSAHFCFCTFWQSCYPLMTAARVGVSSCAVNYFIPQTLCE